MKTQSIDTHPGAERMLISLLRKRNTAEKFAIIRGLSRSAIQLSKRAIARANSGMDEHHVNLTFIELHYGKELARRTQEQSSKHHEDS